MKFLMIYRDIFHICTTGDGQLCCRNVLKTDMNFVEIV